MGELTSNAVMASARCAICTANEQILVMAGGGK